MMPRWVYAPEYDDIYVDFAGNKEHELMAEELYDAYGDSPVDDSGWNKWWGGMIYGGYGTPIEYDVDYAPLAVAAKGTINTEMLPQQIKQKILPWLEKYKLLIKKHSVVSWVED